MQDPQVLLTTIVPLLGVVVTVLTSLFKQISFSVRVKNLIAIVLSALSAVYVVWANGDLLGLNNITSFLAVAVLVYGIAQGAYNFILQGTSLAQALASVNLFGRKSASAGS